MPKEVSWDRPRYLPPLWFDNSGSATARFAGKPALVRVHWANARCQQLKLVCPKSVSPDNECYLCAATPPVDSASRMISVAYDVSAKHWSLYMGHPMTFKQIFEKSREHGVTPAMMEYGGGPDVLMQRIGNRTEVIVMPETIGAPRWDGTSAEAHVTVMESAIAYLGQRSHWTRFRTVAELEAQFPKNGRPEDIAAPVTEMWNTGLSVRFINLEAPDARPADPYNGPPMTPSQEWHPTERHRIVRRDDPTPPAVDPKVLKPIEGLDPKGNDLMAKDDWDFLT